ncbi:MAG: TonB-dependent receptor [Rhodospirillales bacterium]|nr:TonB-dependent receptor [Rhodospirillales bacterium]
MRHMPTLTALRSGSSLLALLVCAMVADAAVAQAQSVPAPASEEVLVTARRREERLQDVPASVAVVTGATLESASVTNLSELAKLVPNFSFDNYYRAGIPYISLRGIATAQGGEAPVAILVDGVQLPALEFVNQDLLDISSVEILRGPQGALYGRGAIAGAMLINTTRPSNTFTNDFLATYSRGDTARVIDTVSGPIVADRLWAKLTVADRYSGGLLYDAGLKRNGDWSRQRSGHLELVAALTDSTRVELRAGVVGGVDGASFLSQVPDGHISDFTIHPTRNLNTTDTRELQSYSVKLEHVTDFGTFTSISQYAHSLSDVLGDADWTTLPIAVQRNNITTRAVNEDLRYSSPTGQRVDWQVGAFFQHRKTTNFLDVFGQAGGPLAGVKLAGGNQDAHSTAYAVYGSANVDLGGGFKFSGALRFDVDDRYDNDRQVPGSAITTSFYALQPQGTLSYQFAPDISGYVTIGRGFRSGGFNAFTDSVALHIPRLYPKETTTNYEAGLKSQFLDRTLTVNLAAYHTDFQNQQFYFISTVPIARNIVSIRAASMNGGELEVTWRPLRNLTFGLGLGVNDSTIDDFDGTALFRGNRTPNSYGYSGNASVEYHFPIFQSFEGMARLDYAKQGPIHYDPTGLYGFGPVNYLNARFAVQSNGWSLAVFGKNLTNTRAPINFSPNAFGPGIGGRIENQPITTGVELTWHL